MKRVIKTEKDLFKYFLKKFLTSDKYRILKFVERNEGCSTRDISNEVEQSLSLISYHMRGTKDFLGLISTGLVFCEANKNNAQLVSYKLTKLGLKMIKLLEVD